MTTQLNITHLSANEGRSFLVLDQLVTFKVTGGQTGGKYNFFEVTVPPFSGPPALHTHPRKHSTFWKGNLNLPVWGSRGLTSSKPRLARSSMCLKARLIITKMWALPPVASC
jgi:hypothetical protein